MVMMSYWFCDKLPFDSVFLHPIIRDSNGEKMSKSKGNVVDPLEIIEGCTLDTILNKLYDGNMEKKDLEKCILLKKKEFPNGMPPCGK
jgi:valyl-tRNA synthetase